MKTILSEFIILDLFVNSMEFDEDEVQNNQNEQFMMLFETPLKPKKTKAFFTETKPQRVREKVIKREKKKSHPKKSNKNSAKTKNIKTTKLKSNIATVKIENTVPKNEEKLEIKNEEKEEKVDKEEKEEEPIQKIEVNEEVVVEKKEIKEERKPIKIKKRPVKSAKINTQHKKNIKIAKKESKPDEEVNNELKENNENEPQKEEVNEIDKQKKPNKKIKATPKKINKETVLHAKTEETKKPKKKLVKKTKKINKPKEEEEEEEGEEEISEEEDENPKKKIFNIFDSKTKKKKTVKKKQPKKKKEEPKEEEEKEEEDSTKGLRAINIDEEKKDEKQKEPEKLEYPMRGVSRPISKCTSNARSKPRSRILSIDKKEVITIPPNLTQKISEFEMINQDPSLKNFEWCIRRRNDHFKRQLYQIESNEKSLENFANSYKEMGLHVLPNGDIKYKEYAPGARGIALFGEFNGWNRNQYWAKRDQYGCWELIIPNDNGQPRIKHGTKVKCNVVLNNGNWADRNPIWIEYLVQNKQSLIFDGVFWNPDQKYEWKFPTKHLPKPKSLRIYEAHVGMSSFDPKVSTYREFADNILPRIKRTGYTAVQLMAIMEHANYASFGYHVNNFFAIASRCGTPEDLMYLVDKAHEHGIFVIIDIVHSHASSNVDDGFNYWDGTDYLYFHGGSMGKHELWDSRLFNYSSYETLRFLLSNCAYYLDKYHFDGFRFDGITSILYRNHGIRYAFSGNYWEYFGDNFDEDGGVYLMLANKLIHSINPEAITIAEDVSGMPGLCLTVEDGGFGFDYRLNMSVSDKWIQFLKEYSDEEWNMGNLVFTLTNRRYNEKHVGYCESHDQSIVGDKTIAMWLFDKEMYWNMSCGSPETIIISRGMALHKMIRMITFALGGEAYLCFMGNEFGHPEWVDFPTPRNGFSFAHCRRRWDLCDNQSLRYKYLYNWDVAMNKLEEVFYFISSPFQYVSLQHEDDKMIVFEKGDLLFVFNFHPYKSYENYKIGTKWGTQHKIVLDSDEYRFFGKGRLEYGHGHFFPIIKSGWNNRPYQFNIYAPSRTCMVLIAEENLQKYDLSKFTFKTID